MGRSQEGDCLTASPRAVKSTTSERFVPRRGLRVRAAGSEGPAGLPPLPPREAALPPPPPGRSCLTFTAPARPGKVYLNKNKASSLPLTRKRKLFCAQTARRTGSRGGSPHAQRARRSHPGRTAPPPPPLPPGRDAPPRVRPGSGGVPHAPSVLRCRR